MTQFIFALLFLFQNDQNVNVFDFEFYLPIQLEQWYQKNNKKKIKSKEWTIGNVYSKPDTLSKQIGFLTAKYNPTVYNFELNFKSDHNQTLKQIKEIGDWGYGIHINVIDTIGDYVKLSNKYFKTQAWIFTNPNQAKQDLISGGHSTFVDQLVTLPACNSKQIGTNLTTKLLSGNYYIKSYLNGEFSLRKEIPEDMDCGEEISNKTKQQDIIWYKVKLKDLQTSDADFNIRLAYPKGC